MNKKLSLYKAMKRCRVRPDPHNPQVLLTHCFPNYRDKFPYYLLGRTI